MKKVDARDLIGGLALVAIGVFAALYASSNYQVGTVAHMGPGFFPAALGWILAAVGAVIVLIAFRAPIHALKPPPFELRPFLSVVFAVAVFGLLVEREARQALAAGGGELVGTVRYAYDDASVAQAVADAMPLVGKSDAILLPDGGNTPGVFAQQLRETGADLSGKRFLGSGQWANAKLTDPAFNGAWYADIDQTRMGSFNTRYEQRFGEKPAPNMVLGYDSLALVAGLVRSGGPQALTVANLESAGGYNGYTGLFRLRPDGRNERGYAVYEIRNGQPQVVSPAPASFRPAF